MFLWPSIAAASSSRVGPRATFDGSPSGRRVCYEDPEQLAAQAGLSLEVYALARMVASEGYSGAGPSAWLALAEAARNKAAERGTSVATLLLRSSDPDANGYFSQQARKKWASTYRDPTGKHVEAARLALEEQTNWASGAVDFFDPATQDGGMQGDVVLTMSAQQYIDRNAASGLHWIGELEGINARSLMLFSRAGQASTDEAMAVAVAAGDDTTLAFLGLGLGLLYWQRPDIFRDLGAELKRLFSSAKVSLA